MKEKVQLSKICEAEDTNQLLQGWNKEGDVLMKGQLNLQQSAQQCLTCQLKV